MNEYKEFKLALYESSISRDAVDDLIYLMESSNEEDSELFVETGMELLDIVTEAPDDRSYGVYRNAAHLSVAASASSAAAAISLNKKLESLKIDTEVLISRIREESSSDKKEKLKKMLAEKQKEIKKTKKIISGLKAASAFSAGSAIANGAKTAYIGLKNNGFGSGRSKEKVDYWEY